LGRRGTKQREEGRKGGWVNTEVLFHRVQSSQSTKNTPLHTAASQGKNLAVKIMLNEGFDAKAKNINLKTPLHLAAEKGHNTYVLLNYDDWCNHYHN